MLLIRLLILPALLGVAHASELKTFQSEIATIAKNKKWSILGQTEYKFLSEDIFNSPIVDNKHIFIGSLGVLYSW